MEILWGVIGVIAAIAVIIYLFILQEGDAKVEVRTDSRTPFEIKTLTDDQMTVRTKVEFANTGSQCATIMDCYVRHLLPYEQFDGIKVASRAELDGAPREDDYFEAVLIQKRDQIYVWVEITLTPRHDQTIKEALANMVDMSIDLVYQYSTRCPWRLDKRRIILSASELADLANTKLAD